MTPSSFSALPTREEQAGSSSHATSPDISLFYTCYDIFSAHTKGIYSANTAEIVEIIRDALRAKLLVLAKSVANSRNRFKASEHLPGYLVHTHANFEVFFPWLICDHLPETSILNYLVETAIKVKACKTSTICLSGSTLYFNALRAISDIDFLEYQRYSTLDPPKTQEPDGFAIHKAYDNYIEYLTDTPFYGPVEITNKIVFLDSTALVDDERSVESSAFQEGPVGHPPRDLTDPVALGRYIHRLAQETLSYQLRRPSKAAKRLLPLGRLMGIPHMTNAVIYSFESPAIQTALRINQKIGLINKIKRVNNPVAKRFIKSAEDDIALIRKKLGPLRKLSEEENDLLFSLDAAVKHIITTNEPILSRLAGHSTDEDTA